LLKVNKQIRVSIVVSIPACHAGDPGSIPGRGAFLINLVITPSHPSPALSRSSTEAHATSCASQSMKN
jgi:hypothetical protein